MYKIEPLLNKIASFYVNIRAYVILPCNFTQVQKTAVESFKNCVPLPKEPTKRHVTSQ